MSTTLVSRLEGLVASLAVKAPCRLKTTANHALTGLTAIDGVTPAAGDRILVGSNTTSTQNGIYVAAAGAWSRALDFDGTYDAVGGTQIYVISGTVNSNSYWKVDGSSAIVFGTTAVTFTSAYIDDSASATFLQAGTGAVSRTMQAKMRDLASVMDYGATGDGTTDDAAAIVAAIAANAGKEIYFPTPSVAYKIGSSLGNIPINTHLRGDSKFKTKILRTYNGGYMANLLDGVALTNLWFDGNGGTYTGGIIDIPVNNGNQLVRDCRFINATSGTCIHITCTGATSATVGGSRSNWDNVETWRVDGTSGSNNYAIVHDDPSVAAGHPMSFTHLETGGYDSIDFGACNNLYLNNCTLFNLKFSDNSRGIHGVSSRIAGSVAYTLKGSGDFIGCSWGSAVTVAALGAYHLEGEFNAGVTDSSGASGACSIVNYTNTTYTPTFYSNSVAITLGNGTVYGRWYRQGSMVYFKASLTVGTTTSGLAAGSIDVSVPVTGVSRISNQMLFTGRIINGAGADRQIGGVLASQDRVSLFRDTSGLVSEGVPITIITSGTVIEIAGYYVP